MRTLVDASARRPSARLFDRQLRFCSLILFPAVVATAAAVNAPAALAATSDLRWHGAPGSPAMRRMARGDEEGRPQRRKGRRQAAGRRGGRSDARSASRSRPRKVAARAARGAPRTVQALQPVAVNGAADTVPLELRSMVAAHPLQPDFPIAGGFEVAADPSLVPESAAPRCKSTHANAFALAVASFARNLQGAEPTNVEGAWPHCRRARHPQSNWRLASLGPAAPAPAPTAEREPHHPIHWRASASCLASPLRAVLDLVAAEFGPLTVNSTCRSRTHNARVGGAPRSYHLTGNAVDFRVRSNYGEVLRFLARLRSVGGLTHYGSGVFHIDTGPRRTWGPRSWGRRRA